MIGLLEREGFIECLGCQGENHTVLRSATSGNAIFYDPSEFGRHVLWHRRGLPGVASKTQPKDRSRDHSRDHYEAQYRAELRACKWLRGQWPEDCGGEG